MQSLLIDTVVALPGESRSEGLVMLADDAFYVCKGSFIYHVTASGEMTKYAGSKTGPVEGHRLEAMCRFVTGLCLVDKKKLFFADSLEYLIRLVEGDQLVTYAGDGKLACKDGPRKTASFGFPEYIAELNGYLYISDYHNAVRRINMETGMVTSIGRPGVEGLEDGSISMATWTRPSYLCTTPLGTLLVADRHCIRTIDFESQTVTTIAGSSHKATEDGPAKTAKFEYPCGILPLPNGDILVTTQQYIRHISHNGIVSTLTGHKGAKHTQVGVDGPLATATLSVPFAMSLSQHGDLYFSDYQAVRRIRGFYPTLTRKPGIYSNLTGALSDYTLEHPSSGKSFPVHLSILKLWNVDMPQIKLLEASTCDGQTMRNFLQLLYGSNLVNDTIPSLQPVAAIQNLISLSHIAGTTAITTWLDDELSRLGNHAPSPPSPDGTVITDAASVFQQHLDRLLMDIKLLTEKTSAKNPSTSNGDFKFTIPSTNHQATPDIFIYVHAWLLYAKWPFFQQMIDSGLAEASSLSAELPAEFIPSFLLRLMRFFYSNHQIHMDLNKQEARYVLDNGAQFGFCSLDGEARPGFELLMAYAAKNARD